jgi:RimJ/RimL family protein N-acetyltransferase
MLRSPACDDAATLARLGSDRRIADSMISLPHPFTPADAAQWVESVTGADDRRGFCIVDGAEVAGVAELRDIDRVHRQAEVSFWIGVSAWGKGLASRALGAVVEEAFGDAAINRLYAYHMVRNPASGRVMAKAKFQLEGTLRQRVYKNGVFEDVHLWGLLRGDRR